MLLGTAVSLGPVEKVNVPQKSKDEDKEQLEGKGHEHEYGCDCHEEPYLFKCIWPPKKVNEKDAQYAADDPDWQSILAFYHDRKGKAEVEG